LPLGKVILRAADCRITQDGNINYVLARRLSFTDLGKMIGCIPVRRSAILSIGPGDHFYAVTPPVVATGYPFAFQEFNLPDRLGRSLQLDSLGRSIRIPQNHHVIGSYRLRDGKHQSGQGQRTENKPSKTSHDRFSFGYPVILAENDTEKAAGYQEK
jgi:hypothetical protein